MKNSILKLLIIVLLVVIVGTLFVACDNNTKNADSEETIKLTSSNYSTYLVMNYKQINLGKIDSFYEDFVYYRMEGTFRSKSKKYTFNNVKIGVSTGQYASTAKLYCELTDDGYGEFSYTDTNGFTYPTIHLYVVSVSGTVTISK